MTERIPVACPKCNDFSLANERSLISCQCEQNFAAVRVSSLTEYPGGEHLCIGRGTGVAIAETNTHTLFSLKPPDQKQQGECRLSDNCTWGAPFMLGAKAEENEYFGKKSSRINIYPVGRSEKQMLHATSTDNLCSIKKYGLLPKTDTRIRKSAFKGHGNPGSEAWLRYTGYEAAAQYHVEKFGNQGVIIPISYDGWVLQTCMTYFPWKLIQLFNLIPPEVGCIRMNEDGDSFVFREDVPLFPVEAKDGNGSSRLRKVAKLLGIGQKEEAQ